MAASAKIRMRVSEADVERLPRGAERTSGGKTSSASDEPDDERLRVAGVDTHVIGPRREQALRPEEQDAAISR